AGVRRIEAVTSSDAFKFMQEHDDLLTQTAGELKVAQLKEVPHRVEELQSQLKEAQKQNEALEAKLAAQQANAVFDNVQDTKQ
ncbi:hypothetical protein NE652_11345, partial [Bifidobacterium pseudocatenulatum]|nr:hypothetical protein [Bifidobacterium pseudocatenulatum]